MDINKIVIYNVNNEKLPTFTSCLMSSFGVTIVMCVKFFTKMLISCEECQKSYTTNKALANHKRQVHSGDDERSCPHCAKIFLSIVAMKRHSIDCPSIRANLWEPKTAIITEKSVEKRHCHVAVEITQTSKQILELYSTFLSQGGRSSILTAQKRKLTEKSVETYSLHLRSYFNFLEQARKSSNDFIRYSIKTNVLRDYIEFLDASNYSPKTISNKIFALERLMGFFHEEIDKLNELKLTTLKLNVVIKTRIKEALEFLKDETKILGPVGRRETIARNCRETLVAEGKWEDLTIIMKQFRAYETEIKSLLATIPPYSCNASRPSVKLIFDYQQYVLLSLVLLRPTMRSQNFVLEILDSPQCPKTADRNGIFINNDGDVLLQYSKYKTAQQYGFLQFYLSDEQSSEIKRFLTYRPWLFPVPSNPNHNFLFSANAKPITKIGKEFKKIALHVFKKNLGISTIRKIMESELEESSLFDKNLRDRLSAAMLHDPATARKYYISKNLKTYSAELNTSWDTFMTFIKTRSKEKDEGQNYVVEDEINTPTPNSPPLDYSPQFSPQYSPGCNSYTSFTSTLSPTPSSLPPSKDAQPPTLNYTHSNYFPSSSSNYLSINSSSSSPNHEQSPFYSPAPTSLSPCYSSLPYLYYSNSNFSPLPNNLSSFSTCYTESNFSPSDFHSQPQHHHQWSNNNVSSPSSQSHYQDTIQQHHPYLSPFSPNISSCQSSGSLTFPSTFPPSNNFFPSPPRNHRYNPPPRVNKQPGIVERDGDWVCKKCTNFNFSRRLFCKCCSYPKFG